MYIAKETFNLLIFYAVRGVLNTTKAADKEIIKVLVQNWKQIDKKIKRLIKIEIIKNLKALSADWYKVLNLYYSDIKDEFKKRKLITKYQNETKTNI